MLNSGSSSPSDRNWRVFLCLIVTVAVGLRIYWAAGFIPVDGAEYARVAYQVWQGSFDYGRYLGPPVIPVRTGMVLPTAAMMALFGPGEAQVAAYPLLSSVVLIVLIYLFSARMFGHRAARVASIIWAFLPIEIEVATTLYPEVPATAFAFLGIYCVYVARDRDNIGSRMQLFYGLAGGLAFGASWLCKASVIYFVPFCLALILFDLRCTRLRRLLIWGGIAAGSLAVLVGEMLFYGLNNGDWLYRFTATHNNYLLYPEFFFTEGARFGFAEGTPFWKAVIKRVAIDGPAMIFFTPHFLFLPSFGAVAALHGLYRRDARFYFMAILFAVLVIAFNGLSVSLQSYQPLPLFSRYFYPICVPAVILTGGMLATLIGPESAGRMFRERAEPLFWGATLVLVLASTIAWLTFRHVRDYAGTWSAAEKHLARVMLPTDRIHTDAISRNGLEFFWRYPEQMDISVYGEPGQQPEIRCNEYVLRNLSYNHWLTVSRGMWLTVRGFEVPAAVQQPPQNWRIQWTNQNATLFRVACD